MLVLTDLKVRADSLWYVALPSGLRTPDSRARCA